MPKKKKTPDWVKRAGRRQLTPQEAAKVEARRVDALMAAKLGKRKPKPKIKPKSKSGWQRLLDALNPERKKDD